MTGKTRHTVLGVLLTFIAVTCSAQSPTTTVVADAVTHEPVAHASLYTKEGGRFRSVVSNGQGIAKVGFQFQRLTVSHLNYERRTVRQLSDTLFLQPRYQTTGEVVVTNKEPEWIRRCLKQTVKRKTQNYFSHDGYQQVDYHTQSMGRDNIYRFHLQGLLRMKSEGRKRYELLADSMHSHIVASDSTRLTDTQNLRRMLYEDFMEDLTRDFISAHRFYHYADYEGASRDEVKLSFKAKHHTDDRGWIILDTTRCVIDYRVSYAQRPDGTLYPAEVRYKMYYAGRDGESTKEEAAFSEQTGGGFPNMEATMTLTPPTTTAPESALWHEMPPSWYVAFNSDADRQREVELSNLPAMFSIFTEDAK